MANNTSRQKQYCSQWVDTTCNEGAQVFSFIGGWGCWIFIVPNVLSQKLHLSTILKQLVGPLVSMGLQTFIWNHLSNFLWHFHMSIPTNISASPLVKKIGKKNWIKILVCFRGHFLIKLTLMALNHWKNGNGQTWPSSTF
jgi:hypothetical protein